MTTLCIAGKNLIAVEALRYCLSNFNKDIEIVCCPNAGDMGENTWQPSVALFAKLNDVRICTLTECESITELVFISLEYDKLIDPAKFKTTRLFNIHFSALPAYKGMYTSAWPLINGEKHSGVTLHKIDTGIDTGDVIDQLLFEIGPDDNARALYEKYLVHGLELFERNIQRLISQNFEQSPQTFKGSTYYGKKSIDYANISIDLNKTAFEIHNMVRAFAFRDFQLPMINGHLIYKSEISATRANGRPGSIAEDGPFSQIVNTVDYQIKFFKDQLESLFQFAETGDLPRIRDLNAQKFDLTVRNKKGWNIFIIAAFHNQIEVLKFLLESGWDVNTRNYRGTTALMYSMAAAQNTGDTGAFDLLIETADSSLKDDSGFDIYHYAAQYADDTLLNRLKKTIPA